LLLHVDRPAIAGGTAIESVRGTLIIEGWTVARGGIASIEIDLDGKRAGAAYYGIRRRDIADAYPGWDGAETSGFALMLPATMLGAGRHRISVESRAKTGLHTTSEFSIEVLQAPTQEGPSVLRRKMPLSEVQLGLSILSGLSWHPRFGLVLGIGETEAEVDAAQRTLASLRDQTYAAWSVVVVRRGGTIPDRCGVRLIEGFDDITGRIEDRLSSPTDTPLIDLLGGPRQSQQPDLTGVLLAGDILGCDALLEMAISSGLHPATELFYSDERRVSPRSGYYEPFFKPQWSPDLLTSTNYIGRFWCAIPSVLSRARATVGEWLLFGDYDLIMRCTEAASEITHVAKLLCERGRPQLDHPDQERAALERARHRRKVRGEIRNGWLPGYYRLKRAISTTALVSIIVPTCASKGLVKTCIETLREKTAYRNFEIICVENIPTSRRHWKAWLRQHADNVISLPEPFNWSRFNNVAAREAKGEFLLFLNDDIEVIEPEWLEALLEHAERPEVGVVGARLLYPDRRVQHAGIIWTPNGGRHAFRRAAETEPGYFALALTERNVFAVTGACLLIRRAEFEEQGGFDESHTIVNNDVDFCLRCWDRGKRVVYTPHATLIHHEQASRQELDDDFDAIGFDKRWMHKLQAGDPFYHPYLNRNSEDYSYDPEPLELVYSSHPLFDRTQIRKILAVKLDHIGDFVTAIPALRRLQQLFPQARLYLLVAPASMALTRLLPGLEGVVEFEFFFARSELGQRQLSQEDYTSLRDRLMPYRFDLAVDLRKAPETRPLLQLSGARWLAGFDHGRQFPWLDIVMEWEQDPATMRKRNHVGDDLVRLIDAIATAAALNQLICCAPRPKNVRFKPSPRSPEKKLVCIHPGVGSVIRQWPAKHYVALIDLLVAAHNVEIVLIGSRDEAKIAEEVLAMVPREAALRSVVGQLPLSELPEFLANTALFIGNNSGPHHLAAALGVPTIGIHSGTVDAREWGPLGPNAVAIRRSVACSPCYLSDPNACWRGLACLTELRPIEVYEVCRRLLV
jgi:ADP-heptose:LPS heptosyltransferase/GT2 family glycosyltransferase